MPNTRIMLIADTHTGSPVGLTPEPSNKIQEQVLDRFTDALGWYGERPDFVIHNGDICEGIDPKLEIDDPKIVSQLQKAASVIVMCGAKREYILVRGTTMHTAAQHQSLEELSALYIREMHRDTYSEDVKVSIFPKLKVTFNDWFTVEARHFIGNSIIFHGRATAPARSQMWNVLNSALESYEKDAPAQWPELLVFAHVHYYLYLDNAWGSVLVLPAWKALGDEWGSKLKDGHVDLGMARVIVGETKEDGWDYKRKLYRANVVTRMVYR